VEFFTLLGRTQSLNHLDERGRFADLRDSEALDLVESPFDRLAHTVDVRNVTAARTPGRYNIPNAGTWLWRLRSYPVTRAQAYFVQRGFGYYFYTFSVLGNDSPIFARARREPDTTTIAEEINLPVPIRRRARAPSRRLLRPELPPLAGRFGYTRRPQRHHRRRPDEVDLPPAGREGGRRSAARAHRPGAGGEVARRDVQLRIQR
jgi:hypothetical protein